MPQFKQNLLHLEGGRKGFNEDCSADSTEWDANVSLGEIEDIVPESSFAVVLHLRQVKVWTRAASDELLGIVEEIESKVENRAAYRLVINSDTGFIEVPPTRSGMV